MQTESDHPSIEGAPFTKDRRQTGGHLGASSDGFRLAYIHRLPAHQLTHIWLDRRGCLQISLRTRVAMRPNDCLKRMIAPMQTGKADKWKKMSSKRTGLRLVMVLGWDGSVRCSVLGVSAACRESFRVFTLRTCFTTQPAGRASYCRGKGRYS